MLKIKINNFQSIENCSFDVEGFTVIFGRNNLGKSALIRAIDSALTNRIGNEFIRWGKTKTEVDLSVIDNTTKETTLDIKWAKGETTTYRVNNESFSKLNRAVPQPIIDAGVKKIEVGERKFNPLVAHQFDELFLIDEPGSVVTDVLSVMYNLNLLNDADELCQKEIRANKSLLKTRESDLKKIQNELDRFSGLEDIKSLLQELKKLDLIREKLEKEIEEIDIYAQHIRTIGKSIASLKPIKTIKMPVTDKPESYIAEYQWLNSKVTEFRSVLRAVKSLERISSITIPDPNQQEKLIEEARFLEKYSTQLKNLALTTRDNKKALDDLQPLESIAAKSLALEEHINDLNIFCSGLNAFQLGATTLKNLKAEVEKADADLSIAQAEFSKYETCPACGKKI